MNAVATKPALNAEERVQRRRLLLTDTISLATLFVITALLAVLTQAFYKSYTAHQAALAQRWAARGELAMRNGKPEAAIDAFRSALADAPGQRNVEIALAEALASAGHTQEAASYFNTLLESEPGNGMINLQLARLAARQGNVSQALDYYHRAIYGNWEGNGYIRRREVRMELVNFLISRKLYSEARNELLVGAGNAPNNDFSFLLQIAQTMEKAFVPADALRIYKTILERHPSSVEALEGAGRTAFQLGHFREARQYLQHVINTPDANRESPQAFEQSRDMLRDATRLLLLYPSSQLSLRAQSMRILEDRQIAQARFDSCVTSLATTQDTPAPPLTLTPGATDSASSAASKSSTLKNSLENLASRLGGHPAKPSESTLLGGQSPSVAMAALAARWKQEPPKITLSTLQSDPDLVQSEIQLIYDTEKVTRQVCGPPSGDDALLLKIAEAPNAVEQE